MNVYEIIEKRRHVNKFKEDVYPDKELVQDLLYKSWKVTPSKNNFMPYTLHVLGPKCKFQKRKVWQLSMYNKKNTNERHNVMDIENYQEDGHNKNFEFLRTVPYLIIAEQRVCEPNPFVRSSIAEGNNIYEQMHEELLDDILKTTAFEVGMFKANLSALCLEQGIDVSCIACTPHIPKPWQVSGFDFIKYPVLIVIGLGYCEESRRDVMTKEASDLDKKPEPETILRWVK